MLSSGLAIPLLILCLCIYLSMSASATVFLTTGGDPGNIPILGNLLSGNGSTPSAGGPSAAGSGGPAAGLASNSQVDALTRDDFYVDDPDSLAERAMDIIKQIITDPEQLALLLLTMMQPTDLIKMLGKRLAKRIAKRVAAAVASKTATRVAIAALRTLMSALIKIPTILDLAMIAFDVLDILDLFGLGLGFNEVIYNKDLQQSIDAANAEGAMRMAQMGRSLPVIAGPLDNLSDEELRELWGKLGPLLVNDPAQPVYADFAYSIADEKFTDFFEGEDDVSDFMELYLNLRPSTEILDELTKYTCIAKDGKLVRDADGVLQCSYRNRSTCDNSYSWPLGKDDTYVEWDPGFNACTLSFMSGIRSQCESRPKEPDKNNAYVHKRVGRDTVRSNCNNSVTYCKRFGLDHVTSVDPVIGEDCHLSKRQDWLEIFFSTSLVRLMKGAQPGG
jgi:hypothetical protein